MTEWVSAAWHTAWPRGHQTSHQHSNCPPGIPPQPLEQKLMFDCVQRQIVFAWTQSLQQRNILIIFADSEQHCFAISAGLISGCLRGSA